MPWEEFQLQTSRFSKHAVMCHGLTCLLHAAPLQAHDASQVLQLDNKPGSIYMGTMCGPEHYVKHDDLPESLCTVRGIGPVKVVVICRSYVLRHSRASIKANPNVLMEAVTPVLNKWLLQHSLSLPTLQECQD